MLYALMLHASCLRTFRLHFAAPASSIRIGGWLIVSFFALMLGGCASTGTMTAGPELLTIEATRYNQAFDAAVEAAYQAGMAAVVRDRRTGVIETSPRIAGSILEPWRTDNASLGQALENTIALQRRRVRFEFIPAGFQPRDPLAQSTLSGPDVLHLDADSIDLTQLEGPLELRAWVYVEQAHTPGVRRSTWTRSLTTFTTSPSSTATGSTFWTTVARDNAYERALLAKVNSILHQQQQQVRDESSTQ